MKKSQVMVCLEGRDRRLVGSLARSNWFGSGVGGIPRTSEVRF